jgi:hypothetical protein
MRAAMQRLISTNGLLTTPQESVACNEYSTRTGTSAQGANDVETKRVYRDGKHHTERNAYGAPTEIKAPTYCPQAMPTCKKQVGILEYTMKKGQTMDIQKRVVDVVDEHTGVTCRQVTVYEMSDDGLSVSLIYDQISQSWSLKTYRANTGHVKQYVLPDVQMPAVREPEDHAKLLVMLWTVVQHIYDMHGM